MVNIPLFIGFQPSFWWCWIVPIRLAILERNSFCHYDPVPSDSREWPMQHRHERLQHVEFPHQGIIHQSLKRCSLLRKEGAFWEEKMVELCWIHGMFHKNIWKLWVFPVFFATKLGCFAVGRWHLVRNKTCPSNPQLRDPWNLGPCSNLFTQDEHIIF